MAFQLILILYWLALSTWFGGVLFIALSAPIIFRTVRESNPILPHILSVNLEGQNGTLLAGSIVANMLKALTRVELICAGAIFVTLAAQFFMYDLTQSNLIALGLRLAMFLAALGIVMYDWLMIWPRIWKYRQEYLDHADEPEIANPAKENFDLQHRQSVSLLSAVLFLLLGLILFSVPAPRTATVVQPAFPSAAKP